MTTLITGRLTFALGAGVRARRGAGGRARAGGWAWSACALGVLTSLSSPVAGAFLALGGGGVVARRAAAAWPVALAASALLPAGAVALAFPEGGTFPFVASSFWPALAAAVALAALLPPSPRVLRIGAALYAAAIVAAFVLPTPMGGNVVRLGALLAGPVAAARAVAAPAAGAGAASRCRWCTGSGTRRSTTGCAPPATRRRRAPTTTAARRASSRATGPYARRDPVHREPLGGRATSRRACRSPAAGSASSTSRATALFYDGRPLTPGALPALAGRQRRRAASRCRRAARLLRRAPRRALVRARPALPARGLAATRHWRVFRVARRRAAWRAGRRAVTAIGSGTVRLRARRAGTRRPARALHALLGARDRPRLRVARRRAAGRG